MQSSKPPAWVEHVAGARRGDAAAREELVTYFTPFVHGVLISHVATNVANEQVPLALNDALTRLGELGAPEAFATWLLAAVRKRALLAAKSPGAMLELPGDEIADGLRALEGLRQLAEPMRERLVLRLLEGISGPEIAEASGATHGEVRNDLERGFATLVKEHGQPVNGDAWLWALTGTPHPAVAQLENALTALRYEPGDLDALKTAAIAPSLAGDDGPTAPMGHKLDEENTSVEAPGGAEPTHVANDVPVAAQSNPFAQQPGTLPASDLPVAAAARRILPGELEPTREAEDTRLRPLTTEVPTTVPVRRPADETQVPTSTPAHPEGHDWRTRIVEANPEPTTPAKPRAFSLTRGATPFVIAAALLGFFAAAAYVYVLATERDARRGWNLVPVTVATRSISEGATVDYDMLSTREVPEQFVTSSVVRPESIRYIANQKIMVPVQAGDPLLWSQFETARVGERLSRRIHPRARAYTLDAKSITSVGGWVRPGDRVDLIVSLHDQKSHLRTASTTLQNVIVLATGKLTQSTNIGLLKRGQHEYSNVSVLALPEEIEILALMREQAAYRMVLRNDEDHDTLDTGHSTPGTLINGDRVRELERRRFKTIQMIRGTPNDEAVRGRP